MTSALEWPSLYDGRLVVIEETSSTNEEALRAISEGAVSGTWILARSQTSGRGRSGRSWVSPPGNLYASLILNDVAPLSHAYQLALVCGVAIHDAVIKATGTREPRRLELKWPNDLLLDRSKVGGILVESSVAGNADRADVVVGIGLNLRSAPKIEGVRTSRLADFGLVIDPEKMVGFLDYALQHWLSMWMAEDGFHQVRRAWLARSVPLGTGLTVTAPDGPFQGSFAGLSSEGYLLLADARGHTTRHAFGDVSVGV